MQNFAGCLHICSSNNFTQHISSPDRNTHCVTPLFCFTSLLCLVFVSPSIHCTYSTSLFPSFLTNLKEVFQNASGFHHCALLSHSSSSSLVVRGSALCFVVVVVFFFFAPSTCMEFDGLSVQHLTATLKSLVFQDAVLSSFLSKMVVQGSKHHSKAVRFVL